MAPVEDPYVCEGCKRKLKGSCQASGGLLWHEACLAKKRKDEKKT
jgi:hypothetical protein